MSIKLTRENVLNLMQELPVDHWFQGILMDELQVLNSKAVKGTPAAMVVPEFPPTFKYLGTGHPDLSKGECQWSLYGSYCGHQILPGSRFCKNHAEKTCRVCGAEAVKGCPTEYQFVCGAPLCEKHERCEV